jgi:hypothetical protein
VLERDLKVRGIGSRQLFLVVFRFEGSLLGGSWDGGAQHRLSAVWCGRKKEKGRRLEVLRFEMPLGKWDGET